MRFSPAVFQNVGIKKEEVEDVDVGLIEQYL